MALTVGVRLASDHVAAIDSIIARLRARTGVDDISHPPPHLTLLVLLEAPSLDRVDRVLEHIAAQTRSFTARARGFGFFADEQDQLVLYTPVVRAAALTALHRSLFDAFTNLGASVDGHYQPDNWIPHITLCNRRLTADLLGDFVTILAGTRTVAWRLAVDHVARFWSVETAAFPLRSASAVEPR